ncbi:sugar ABC transporter substrate-binding protein [Crossiella sp. SN42]|uniref:sugar ABC transporter substrate-binding protein n=1 Tax=Crossiella sp. SN42 TaxID=2944808 RepID=UPI00207CCC32|nr:substrate-binding domain-containing protein [Crossiella sp. SN42]MCO1574812.1 sugar ABC transporter substrate-binding protein [Crossiella sp. SN42]
MPRKSSVVAAAAAIALTAAACGQESNGLTVPPSSGDPKICLVMKSLANEFFKNMKKGAEDYVAGQGGIKLTASGIPNETDVDGQVAEVEKCVTQKVDAIVLAPADSTALIASVKKAVDAGIKVVNIDVELEAGALRQANLDVPFVGPDNREGARLAGVELAKVLGPRSKVIILEGIPGAANGELRVKGFKDAIQENQLVLVASRTANWETDQAHSVLGALLTANADVKGVLAANDSMALGAVKAIEEAGLGGKVKVASFDNIPAIKPLLQNGSVVATVEQHATSQAARGIDQAIRMVKGEKVTGWQKTPVEVKTKSAAG